MKKTGGFSMIEVLVTIAIVGGSTLGIVRVTQILNNLGSTNMEKQLMNNDASILLMRMGVKIEKAGDGVLGSQDINSGKTILALPDNALENSSPTIIFFSKDNAPTGIGPEDYWTSYSTASQNGQVGVLETVYMTDSWLKVKNNTATLIGSTFIKTQKGVTLKSLGFIFYDGQYPPQIANQSPQATSAVRITIGFKSSHSFFSREHTVNLNNLIYGPH